MLTAVPGPESLVDDLCAVDAQRAAEHIARYDEEMAAYLSPTIRDTP